MAGEDLYQVSMLRPLHHRPLGTLQLHAHSLRFSVLLLLSLAQMLGLEKTASQVRYGQCVAHHRLHYHACYVLTTANCLPVLWFAPVRAATTG